MLYYSKVAVSLLPSQPSSTNGLGTKTRMFDGIFQLSASLKGGYAEFQAFLNPLPLHSMHKYITKLLSGLSSQPSFTNELGTKACLIGSSKSRLVSKEPIQHWKPRISDIFDPPPPYIFIEYSTKLVVYLCNLLQLKDWEPKHV